MRYAHFGRDCDMWFFEVASFSLNQNRKTHIRLLWARLEIFKTLSSYASKIQRNTYTTKISFWFPAVLFPHTNHSSLTIKMLYQKFKLLWGCLLCMTLDEHHGAHFLTSSSTLQIISKIFSFLFKWTNKLLSHIQSAGCWIGNFIGQISLPKYSVYDTSLHYRKVEDVFREFLS